MKKIILLLLLVLVSVTASARKSYIMFRTEYVTAVGRSYLYGDVPNNIEGAQDDSSNHRWIISSVTPAETLNLLSEYGYEVESITQTDNSTNNYLLYLLSKEISSGQNISKGDVNTDGEVNIADVNEVISLILGIVREHPEILKQIKK